MAAKRKQWSDMSMATAVEEVKKQELLLREASRMYIVPFETLRRRVIGTVAVGCQPGQKNCLDRGRRDKNSHIPH